MANIIYKIYYGNEVVYLGRTHQELKDRIRAHVFNNPKAANSRIKAININNVSKIEFAECETEADMFLYEIYYINKLKPRFNTDDKASDDLKVVLPDLVFNIWVCSLWDEWKEKIRKNKNKQEGEAEFYKNIESKRNQFQMMYEHGDITEEEFKEKIKEIEVNIAEQKYKEKKISLREYLSIKGKSQL